MDVQLKWEYLDWKAPLRIIGQTPFLRGASKSKLFRTMCDRVASPKTDSATSEEVYFNLFLLWMESWLVNSSALTPPSFFLL